MRLTHELCKSVMDTTKSVHHNKHILVISFVLKKAFTIKMRESFKFQVPSSNIGAQDISFLGYKKDKWVGSQWSSFVLFPHQSSNHQRYTIKVQQQVSQKLPKRKKVELGNIECGHSYFVYLRVCVQTLVIHQVPRYLPILYLHFQYSIKWILFYFILFFLFFSQW